MDLYSQQRRNRRLTWLLMAGFVGLFLVLGFLLDYGRTLDHVMRGGAWIWSMPFYTAGAMAMSVGGSAWAYFSGDQMILHSVGARPLNPEVHAERQLQNVVEEMAIATGLPVPQVYLLPDSDPNAFATGRSPQEASMGVTDGLLGIMNREELQAVIAHEMGHIRNLDIRLMMIVSVLLGAIALMSDIAVRQQYYRPDRRSDRDDRSDGGLWALLAIVLAILAPFFARLVAMAVSRTREYEADRSAAESTRNPLALASALEKLDAHNAPTRVATQGTAHLFMVDPTGRALNDGEGGFQSLFATHPPIAKRIERLREMGYAAAGPQG